MPRRIFRIRGTVQGVGFRPFVYRAACALGLAGRVWNDADGVVVDAEGASSALDALGERLARPDPPHARVESVAVEEAAPSGAVGFAIDTSAADAPTSARVAPDLATCDACLRELFDPADRRFRYPFLNCTDCGPRYSIARDVPYDRARTTMSAFAMCAACAAEYHDPASRRFHAQPNACRICGPRLWIESAQGELASVDPVADAVAALRDGAIVALKGVGGFHLACDARDEDVVSRLRDRKRRPAKPFAVMFEDLAAVEREAHVAAGEAAALVGPRRPIVLLRSRGDSSLANGVAPSLRELGAFLPATPLHHLLLRAFGGPLVMTSGNRSEEPIAAAADDARRRLRGIADLFLVHDRAIHLRADDSVVRVLGARERLVRRARGHAPEAIPLGFAGPSVLAVGADLKNALCLTTGDAAILSQHVGDLESYESQRFHDEVRAHLTRLFRVEPVLVAHDLHPGYHSTVLARRAGLPLEPVQHHHAHVASCLADNDRRDRVIGVAWDGTGYGDDGTVWGGEILVADLGSCKRVGRIRPAPMPGGDAAVREPWRMALAHLLAAGLPIDRIRHPAKASVEAMIREGANVTPTSSAGRLFDAVASLLGVADVATYEGQAAVELEAIASDADVEPYALPIDRGGLLELDARALVRAVVEDIDRGLDRAQVSARVHASLAAAITEACRVVRERVRLDTVALSGGCFQSARLTRSTHARLTALGFEVLLHARVPPNDGGLALGQAVVAAWRHRPGR
jgi:hydrogenase maturation protein HypF